VVVLEVRQAKPGPLVIFFYRFWAVDICCSSVGLVRLSVLIGLVGFGKSLRKYARPVMAKSVELLSSQLSAVHFGSTHLVSIRFSASCSVWQAVTTGAFTVPRLSNFPQPTLVPLIAVTMDFNIT
jgi:hypothetical protein